MVSQADMGKIFEPVMKDILSLIGDQVRRAGSGVAAVLLVGGFGQNSYLKSRVQKTVGSSIAVLQPENGWTAVVRGAAMLGVGSAAPELAGVSIISRCARQSYGVQLSVMYDPKKHSSDRV